MSIMVQLIVWLYGIWDEPSIIVTKVLNPIILFVLFPSGLRLGVEFDDGSKFSVGKNYTLEYNLNVRFGPGTGYAKKTYNQLTPNAKKNALKTGVLKAGTVVTCLEIKYTSNQIWIRIPSGWICAQDNGEDYIK